MMRTYVTLVILSLFASLGCVEPSATQPVAAQNLSTGKTSPPSAQPASSTGEVDDSRIVKEPQPTSADPPPAKSIPNSTGDTIPTNEAPLAKPIAETTPISLNETKSADDPPKEEPPKKQPLFVDWPKPEYVLVFTGQQQGFLEPCGCTGLANQKGGVARRATLLQQLKAKGWDLVSLDVGNHVRRFGKQQAIKFQRSADALRGMGYRAAALGIDDLKLDTGEVLSGTNNDDKPSLFLSANVALLDRSLTPEYRVIEAGGKKIGVTAVLGDSYLKQLTSDEIVRTPAQTALPTIVEKLTAEKCDRYILLAHATADETAELAKKFPLFQIVATSSGVGEPPLDLEEIPNTKALKVEVGTKGMFVMVVGVYDDPKQPYRTQRVPLDDRFEDAPPMRAIMANYQAELKALGLDGLGLAPLPHPTDLRFAGSDKCGECHTKAFAIWEKTPHAHATDSLVNPKERGDVARHFDPECLSCHVTGWDPQKMHPFATGFTGLTSSPKMLHNGCENCHGPGAKHADVEEGLLKVTDAERDKLRNQLKLPLEGDKAKNKCVECHDIDNSPDFHTEGAFEKYWKKVEHKGKD